MDEQQLQQQIIQLVQAAMQGDQQATQQIQQIMQAAQQGDQQAAQLAQMIQAVAQQMQQQQVQAAKFGAKLNYIRQLRGLCPEGQELEYYRDGGRLCKRCIQKNKMQDGGEVPNNPVDAFKCGRKMKKAEKGTKVTGHNGLKGTETKSKDQGRTVTTREWEDGTQSQRVANPHGGFTYYGRDGRQYDSTIRQEKQGADSLKRVDWKPVKKKNK